MPGESEHDQTLVCEQVDSDRDEKTENTVDGAVNKIDLAQPLSVFDVDAVEAMMRVHEQTMQQDFQGEKQEMICHVY